MTEPRELVGTFVVEVGERQAWPFITFCDYATTPPREVRLYIDTGFSLDGEPEWPAANDPAVIKLLPVNSLAVTAVELNGAELSLTFENDTLLVVSGAAAAWTTGDVWWLAPWTQ